MTMTAKMREEWTQAQIDAGRCPGCLARVDTTWKHLSGWVCAHCAPDTRATYYWEDFR